MEDFKKRNKILVVISVFILLVVALLVSKTTYSFLEPIDPDDVIIDSEITATGDTLLFTKGTDINVVLSQDNFNSASGNLVRSVTPQVKLVASNKTNNATATYYVSVNISENTFKYTNGTNNPEILLTVTDNDGNPLTTCTGLTYTTVGGVSGFDITNKMGVYDFAEQTISTTSSTTGTTKNWTYTVTFINKTTDQSINEDAKISVGAILHKEPEDFCELNPDSGGCDFTLLYNPSITRHILLQDGNTIYYHDETLENGAGDGSYRYAGANPNNYICFGSEAQTCPADNIYRIIGVIPVDVVIDNTTTPVTTERQLLFKLIKNDYENESSLGMTKIENVEKQSPFTGPSGNQPAGDVDGFYWSGSTDINYNTWSLSTLNTIGLNTNAYGAFSSSWQDKIASVVWKVGGNEFDYLFDLIPITLLYQNEIINPLTTNTQDNSTDYIAKIGMLYISDYAYAASSNAWSHSIGGYNDVFYNGNDWLFRGVKEWTITRKADSTRHTIYIKNDGSIYYHNIKEYGQGVRRTFYLTEDTVIDMSTHSGTLADPYRIS